MNRSPHKSPKNKGRASSSANHAEETRQKRDRVDNWSALETNVLLDTVGEVKLQRGMNSINFKDYTEIHAIFKERVPNSTRTAENCKNRVKHLKSQFNAARRLTTLSGGYQWDYNTNLLSAPREAIEAIIRGNRKKLSFLKRPFTWYLKFETMCGGERAEGEEEETYGDRTDAERNGDEEGSGSSDTPDVGGPVRGRIQVDVAEDPYPNAAYSDFSQPPEHDASFTHDVRQQGSDNTMPTSSRSSGSIKRKSSDGAGPSVSRGKKIKETFNLRTQLFKSVADNDEHTFALNQRLVSIFQGQLSVAEKKLNKKDTEIDACTERLAKMKQIQGVLRVEILERFTDDKARNIWLRGTEDDVYHWINKNFPELFSRLRQQQQASQPFPNQNHNPPFSYSY